MLMLGDFVVVHVNAIPPRLFSRSFNAFTFHRKEHKRSFARAHSRVQTYWNARNHVSRFLKLLFWNFSRPFSTRVRAVRAHARYHPCPCPVDVHMYNAMTNISRHKLKMQGISQFLMEKCSKFLGHSPENIEVLQIYSKNIFKIFLKDLQKLFKRCLKRFY